MGIFLPTETTIFNYLIPCMVGERGYTILSYGGSYPLSMFHIRLEYEKI